MSGSIVKLTIANLTNSSPREIEIFEPAPFFLALSCLWACSGLEFSVEGEEFPMKPRIFCTLTLTLALAFPGPCAFAQAAAESVLLNGSTGTATVKAGSALGSVFNQSMRKIAGQRPQPASRKTSQVHARALPTTSHQAAVAYPRLTPAQGPMISSIQGVGTTCASTHPPASTPESKAAAETASTNCAGPDSSAPSSPDKYKSVITLSISK